MGGIEEGTEIGCGWDVVGAALESKIGYEGYDDAAGAMLEACNWWLRTLF